MKSRFADVNGIFVTDAQVGPALSLNTCMEKSRDFKWLAVTGSTDRDGQSQRQNIPEQILDCSAPGEESPFVKMDFVKQTSEKQLCLQGDWLPAGAGWKLSSCHI